MHSASLSRCRSFTTMQQQANSPQPCRLAGKWDRYYAAGTAAAPFDSARVSSQLVDYLCSCVDASRTCSDRRPLDVGALARVAAQAPLCLPPQDAGKQGLHVCERCAAHKPPAGERVLELGCGTGASSRWMARHGFRVTAVDISAAALQAAAAAASTEALPADNPQLLCQDIFELDAQQQAPVFGFIYDCQVYHVLVRDQPEDRDRLPQLLFDLLQPGGFLMILAGNANEPEVGPNVLTAEKLLRPLLAVGFELVLLHQTRFDPTHHYVNVLGMRPLAWWVVLQRPE